MQRNMGKVAFLITFALSLVPGVVMASEPGPVVAVVIETRAGLPAASSLRKQLAAQTHCQIVSLSEATKDGIQPAIIVTVSLDSKSRVSVLYWDRGGKTDLLAAKVPNKRSAIEMAALALASAMLQKYHPAPQPRMQPAAAPARPTAITTDPFARVPPSANLDAHRILAALRQLGYVKGRTGPLTSHDF